ncbi:AmmeMemoRadiSam system protein B [Candidatus Uhrbacteria bacterium]|nr:AmmeMemoRadiSam system protein B [Candidatus Uhrbacteria bacterium]
MIIFSAIVPHSPLLVPSIGKDQREKLSGTIAAMQEIEQALYITKPDTICIVAPHGSRYPDAYSINMSPKYVGDFKTFGDFSTTISNKGNFLLIDHLQRKMREENVPFTLTSNENLDYGFSVPILLLTSHLDPWKLIPITPSMLDGNSHYQFGAQLKRVLHAESSRVAIIASADLSHKLSKEAPGGYSAEGEAFDKAMTEAISKNDIQALLTMDPNLVENASQCGYRPIMTMLGCLDGIKVKASTLCYESPFGVGYLTARYDIV